MNYRNVLLIVLLPLAGCGKTKNESIQQGQVQEVRAVAPKKLPQSVTESAGDNETLEGIRVLDCEDIHAALRVVLSGSEFQAQYDGALSRAVPAPGFVRGKEPGWMIYDRDNYEGALTILVRGASNDPWPDVSASLKHNSLELGVGWSSEPIVLSDGNVFALDLIADALADPSQVKRHITAEAQSPEPAVIAAIEALDGGFTNDDWRTLVLEDTKITDAEMLHLKELTSLRVLVLSNTQISDAGLAHLTKLNRLRHLYLNGTQITDAGTEHLKDLINLEFLDLDNTQINGSGLRHIEQFTKLEQLWLRDTQVTDAGLQHLVDLPVLQDLLLDRTHITDGGLEHLKGLSSLQDLSLSGTQISDAGLVLLQGLIRLEHLNLSHTQISDAGLQHLNGLTSLIRLGLVDTKVNGTGLKHLRGLRSLESLYLAETQISDAELEHLVGFTGLRAVLLKNTQVTNAGIEALRAALPNCQVDGG